MPMGDMVVPTATPDPPGTLGQGVGRAGWCLCGTGMGVWEEGGAWHPEMKAGCCDGWIWSAAVRGEAACAGSQQHRRTPPPRGMGRAPRHGWDGGRGHLLCLVLHRPG